MTTLAAVLVRQRDLPLETVEQAMLRQSLFGGDLATNLLELGSIDEPTLLAATAATLAVPPAVAVGRIPRPAPELLRSFAVTQLLDLPFLPLADLDSELLVAVSAPLPASVELDLKQRFGKPIALRAALEARIRQAICSEFGKSLDERTTRLLDRLDGASLTQADELPHTGEQAAASRDSAAAVKRSLLPKRPATKQHGQPRRLGPFTTPMVEIEFASAQSPGDIIAAWLDFAAQYFDYTAVFTVQGDIAAGKAARGAGTIGEAFSRIGVPLDMPSALQRTRATGTWQLTSLEPRGLDRTLARDLGRPLGPQILLVPICVRERVVLLTYGDHGEEDVSLDRVGDILALQPLAERHLERLLVARKRGTRSVHPPVPSSPSNSRSDGIAKVQDRSAAAASETSTPALSTSTGVRQPDAASTPNLHESRFSAELPADVATASRDAGTSTPRPDLTFDAPRATPNVDTGSIDESWDLIQPILSGGRSNSIRPTRSPSNAPSARARDSLPPDSGWPSTSTRPGVAPKLELVAEPESDAAQSARTAATSPQGNSPLLPAARAESHPAHAPSPRVESQEMALPTVVISHEPTPSESACIELLEQYKSGNEGALEQLIAFGEVAVEVLMRDLPGPISARSRAPRAPQLLKASDCGPVLKALVALGPVARPNVIAHTDDADPNVRLWTIRLLGELGGAQSAIAVAQRVVLDRDAEVRRAAFGAAHQLLGDPDAAAALRQAFLGTAADQKAIITQRLAAIDALADLRDAPAIPSLIELLADPNPGTAAAAQQALIVLGRQDFGYDAKSWSTWWKANAGRDRIEWVIDALDHRSPAIRQAASEELRLISRLYVGNVDDESLEARSKVQKKYRDWWASGGRTAGSPGSGPGRR